MVRTYKKKSGLMTKAQAGRVRKGRISIGRSLRFSNNVIHAHKVTTYNAGLYLLSLTTNPILASQAFSLNLVLNSLEFVALYDVFKIQKIVFEIIPQFNVQSVTSGPLTANQSAFPAIHSVIDYNDTTIPTGIVQLVEYNSYKHTRGGQSHKRVLKPKYSLSSVIAGSSANVAEESQRWLNTNVGTIASPSSNNVNHYGIKWITDTVPALTGTDTIGFDLKTTYYLLFKNTK